MTGGASGKDAVSRISAIPGHDEPNPARKLLEASGGGEALTPRGRREELLDRIRKPRRLARGSIHPASAFLCAAQPLAQVLGPGCRHHSRVGEGPGRRTRCFSPRVHRAAPPAPLRSSPAPDPGPRGRLIGVMCAGDIRFERPFDAAQLQGAQGCAEPTAEVRTGTVSRRPRDRQKAKAITATKFLFQELHPEYPANTPDGPVAASETEVEFPARFAEENLCREHLARL